MSDHLSEIQRLRTLIEAAERPAISEAGKTAPFRNLDIKMEPTGQLARSKIPAVKATGTPSEIRKQFNRAFAAARKRGLEQFLFNGKLYTTELASDKAARVVPGRKPLVSGPRLGDASGGDFTA